MKNQISYICTNETVYSTCTASDDKKYIIVDKSSTSTDYCPMDVAAELVTDYLNIGFLSSKNADTFAAVYDFISKYGAPNRNSSKVDVKAFSEDAEVLYLHFSEISSDVYPIDPEWILETDPMSAVITRDGNNISMIWQTDNLLNSIEITYTMMLCNSVKQLGICKHCGAPFYTKNPKSEFCSPQCRNRFNVYKSRKKHK